MRVCDCIYLLDRLYHPSQFLKSLAALFEHTSASKSSIWLTHKRCEHLLHQRPLVTMAYNAVLHVLTFQTSDL
jgi:hypothetical protein